MTMRFLLDRAAAADACKYFLADHPTSRYVPNVLYIQARVLDTRIDERRLTQYVPGREPGLDGPVRELYTDFPHAQSRAAWGALYNDHPHSRLSIAAGVRLAQLALREGQVDAAIELLRGVRERGREWAEGGSRRGGGGLLRAAEVWEGLEFEPEPYWHEARHLLELIDANRDDPRYGDAPLVAWARLDPHRLGYGARLLELVREYPESLMTDNLLVSWAMSLSDPQQRGRALAGVLKAHDQGDARAEALFWLADLEAQRGVPAGRAAALRHLDEIIAGHADTWWAERALEMRRLVGARDVAGRS